MGILDVPGISPAAADSKFAAMQTDRGREWLVTKKSIALREWYRTLALRNTTPATVYGIGDSISEGKGATSYLTRWTRALGPALRTNWPTTGAAGHPAGYIEAITSFSPTYTDFPVAYVSPWARDAVAQKGIGMSSLLLQQGGSITLTVSNATSVDLFFYKVTSGTRVISWAVDGGTATNINTVGGSAVEDMVAQRITLPNLSTHTITVTGVGANGSGLSGWYVYNGDETKGIRVFANGRSSYGTDKYMTVLASITQQTARVQPSAVVIELGANDYQNGTPITAAAFKSNLLAIIAAARAGTTRPPSIILMPVWQWSPGVAPVDTWANFVTAMYEIAAGDQDICIFDAQQRMGLQTSNDLARGLLSDDLIHPSDAGHWMIAQSLARFLGPA